MTEAVSILPGPVVPEGLAPDIVGRIMMALDLMERLRSSLAEKLAAFAGVPAALRVGLGQLRDHGGVVPTALTFCLMLAVGVAAERLIGPRARPSGDPRPDQDAAARLVGLLLAGARDL